MINRINNELLEACKAQKRLIEDMMRFVGQMALKDYQLLNEAPILADNAISRAEQEGKKLRLLSIPPIDWAKEAEAMKLNPSEMDVSCRFLEGLADTCATFAAYLEERYGYGCGDQGHEKGVKKANKVGRLLWCKGFGYTGYHDVTV